MRDLKRVGLSHAGSTKCPMGTSFLLASHLKSERFKEDVDEAIGNRHIALVEKRQNRQGALKPPLLETS
jgi:hypothetical protein